LHYYLVFFMAIPKTIIVVIEPEFIKYFYYLHLLANLKLSKINYSVE